MPVRHVKDIPVEAVESGIRTYRQVLIGPHEGPNFAMRRFILEAGGEMPPHTNSVEHEQYVLGGCAKIGIGEDVFEVSKNSVVFIPAGVAHWYRVEGDEPFEFLCMVPNLPDQIQLIEQERHFDE